MSVKLNHGAEGHARGLIGSGDYDADSQWSFEGADGDKLLGPQGDDWAEYRQWFLGEDGGATDQKGTYSYPYGKGGKVYGQALRAIRSRASQQGATDVFDASGRLLDQLNAKEKASASAAASSGKRIRGDFYTMLAAAGVGEILLYQDIGDAGFYGEAGITAEGFAKDLRALGNIKQINCRINSPGGNVFVGQTIYNLLAAHPAQVNVHIDGLAASIASVVAMAGDVINIADNGTVMIHNAWGMGIGTAEDLEKTAATLRLVTGQIAGTYAKRSGANMEAICAMMADETWMNAKQAKEIGLVDNIVDNMRAAACVFDPRRFRHTPRPLAAEMNSRPRRDQFEARLKRAQVSQIKARRA
jgi:ATP-dependent Clp endopeptidase proteolytic subunit ClpP